MTTFTQFLARELACKEGVAWVAGRPCTRELWRAFERPDWSIWLAHHAGVDIRRIVLASAACAWRVLPLVREQDRAVCAHAVELARRYGRGEPVTRAELRSAADDADDAADDAADAAYADASAEAAAYAAYAATAATAAADAAYAAASADDAYADASAEAAAYAASADAAATAASQRLMCRTVRHCIGWPRLRAALIAKGVEVGP